MLDFDHGYEYNLVIGVVALALAFAGPGSLSPDALRGEAMSGPLWGLAALLVSVLGAVISLLDRRSVPVERNTAG